MSSQGSVTLKIGGEELVCVDKVPVWQTMKMVAAMESGDEAKQGAAMYTYMRSIVVPEEHEHLDRVMDAFDWENGADELNEALGNFMAEIANRPKEPAGASPASSFKTREPLQRVSFSPVTEDETV